MLHKIIYEHDASAEAELFDVYPTLPNLDLILKGSLPEDLDPLLSIRKVLWNEHSVLELDDDMFWIAVLMYKRSILVEVDFASLIKEYMSQNLLTSIDYLNLIYLLTESVQSFAQWESVVLEQSYLLSLMIPKHIDVLNYYHNTLSALSPDDFEHYEHKGSLIESIHGHPDIFQEHIGQYSTATLNELLPWVSIEIREYITEYLVQTEVESVSATTWDELDAVMQSTKFLKDFPESFRVLGDKLSSMPARPLDMDLQTKIPAAKIHEWLPKYVFSRPDYEDTYKIFFPGGPHIGHSSILVKTRHGLLLLDYGMSVVNNRTPRWLPLLQKVDAVLLTHAHLDHSGALPLLLRSDGPNAKVPWFGTANTKTMVEMLYYDTSRVLNSSWDADVLQNHPVLSTLVAEKNIVNALNNFNRVKAGETFSVLPNVEVTAYGASHLFGSVGYELKIGNKHLLYTGDFKLDKTKVFPGAKFPHQDVDTLIFDGTNYGRYESTGGTFIPERSLEDVLADSKRVLIPAFSMGRTQEILYHLIELGAHKNWRIIATGMGGRLIKQLNLNIPLGRSSYTTGISTAPTILAEEFTEKTIVVGGNGMLQAGLSRELLDYTKHDTETSVVICGYQSPNTMGYHLLTRHPVISREYRQKISQVHISGHSKANSLDSYLQSYDKNRVIVHYPEGMYEKGKVTGILRPKEFLRL